MRCLLALLLLPTLLFSKEHAHFHPPDKWLVSDPSTYAPSVSICFVSKKKEAISPSINLAAEEHVPSMQEYLDIIRALHLKNPAKRWRNLGTLQANGITGTLTEIDTTVDGKKIRMLQGIFIQNGTAYILTAAAPTPQMPEHYEPFLRAFKSFTISQNLLESIPEKKRRESLDAELTTLRQKRHESDFEKRVWSPFEKRFLKEFADMGSHWQILVLKEARQNI